MGGLKERMLVRLRSGLGTRLLLTLFALLVICIVFIGLDDISGYILGYLATAVILLLMVRGWRSIKNYVILMLVAFGGAVFLSFLYVEVISRIAVWIWGEGATDSTPLRVIETIIGYVVLFIGVMGVVFGFIGTLVLGILRLIGMRKRERTAGNT